MRWEERLLGLFDDLEQQAEAMALTSRDAEVEELGRAEYSQVDLVSRLHASIGCTVQLTVRGTGSVRGRLAQVGSGWCLVGPEGTAGHEWVVGLAALTSARGLSSRAVPEPVRPVVGRLGLGSVLRGIAEEGEAVTVLSLDGDQRRGRVLRVGADFAELATEDGTTEVLAFSGIAVLRRR